MRIHAGDDLIVALKDLEAGTALEVDDRPCTLPQRVPAKQKFAARPLSDGQRVRMYGVTVGAARGDIATGQLITTDNLVHATDAPRLAGRRPAWPAPDVTCWASQTFKGFHRSDGRVGTANHWLVIPLVFCENRNIQTLREALVDELGYGQGSDYRLQTRRLIEQHRGDRPALPAEPRAQRVFPNVDGIKFLTHSMGCGGTRDDARTLCGLLAGYINHPNVAGATVLSLGCQNAQVGLLRQELHHRNPHFDKPLIILDQQQLGTESALIGQAISQTFAGLVEADRLHRAPAPLSGLTIGVECGGSDGFSGITANPAIGHCADLLVALGGAVILSEFPELFGTEQELVDRCTDPAVAARFLELMRAYHARAVAVGSWMDRNPSPGNIADGLITDAMKSAGAVRKGGTSPVVDVLDYPEPVARPGLSLLCTPGNDVESTTAMAASGANLLLFSTGLGTPTGNPVAPTLKISTHSALAARMPDIIDLDAGAIITGRATIRQIGEQILDLVIRTASGDYTPRSVALGQDDFIPWKRGVSL